MCERLYNGFPVSKFVFEFFSQEKCRSRRRLFIILFG